MLLFFATLLTKILATRKNLQENIMIIFRDKKEVVGYLKILMFLDSK